MGLRLSDAAANVEKITGAQFDSAVETNLAASGDSRKLLVAGTQWLMENLTIAASTYPFLTMYRYLASRTVTDGVLYGADSDPVVKRKLTSATANFTSADLGALVTGTNIGGSGVNQARIVSVTNTTTVQLSAASNGSPTGVSVTIGANRILRISGDLGAGAITHRFYGLVVANKETTAQTGDLFAAYDELGNRLWGVTVAGVPQVATGYAPSAATDVSDKRYVDTRPRVAQVTLFGAGDDVTTGVSGSTVRIPAILNGYNLTAIAANVSTTSSSGNPTVMAKRGRQSSPTSAPSFVDMLSTAVSVDASEYDSKDAGTAAAINTSNDDVATGDVIEFDVTTAGTGTKGLSVTLTFTLP